MKLTKRVLHRAAKPVEFVWPMQNQQLAKQMLSFMRSNNGIGLAAPQIGISRRLFVMSVDGLDRVCCNPEITGASDVFVEFAEGCLSFPGDQCIIKRPGSIQVRYYTAEGTPVETELRGLEARCFQHELDHLDGTTMYDRYDQQHAK